MTRETWIARIHGPDKCDLARLASLRALSPADAGALLFWEKAKRTERSQRRFFAPFKLHVSAILKELRLKSRTQAALLASQLQAENAIRLSVGNSLKKRRTAQRGTRH